MRELLFPTIHSSTLSAYESPKLKGRVNMTRNGWNVTPCTVAEAEELSSNVLFNS